MQERRRTLGISTKTLASIDVNVEEGEMVQFCLEGLASFGFYLYKGEYTVIFQLTLDAPCRGEPRRCVNKYARQQQDVVHEER